MHNNLTGRKTGFFLAQAVCFLDMPEDKFSNNKR